MPAEPTTVPAMIIAAFCNTQPSKAMNRSLANVLFSGFGDVEGEASEISGSMKPIEAPDVGVMMAFADKVLIVPGYGMAVAQAQHKVWELAQLLRDRGVDVKFAIHPVAGRMPGPMNVIAACPRIVVRNCESAIET